ncbi:hypothetical protein BS47DRAFT_1333573 [Hydnum rufescens UP504]|uniref:Protein BCP1 n=1 Tax=Hydnum rufescens UP504 TaxID=1448309 RepID=A0A9P6AJH3_9AGAM|nr:hypothetical protein BS47DRAFT_1333573 [Hydnum rufescens UP504]
MLAQLFQADAELLHTHELAELIISQPLLGTTVKTDGIESDPYAFLTVLNLRQHRGHVAIKALIEYALAKSSDHAAFHQALRALIGPTSSSHVGFIVSERLINMPVQVAPPMYKLLSDEIRWAIEENEPYQFSHYLCISRTYHISEEDENAMEGVESSAPPAKRQKTPNKPHGLRTFSYHQEDEIWEKFGSHVLDFKFTHEAPRDAESIGVHTAGKLMLLPAEHFPLLVAEMQEKYAAPS